MVAIIQKRKIRDFDWFVGVLAIGIVLFGAWEIHNAQPTETFWQKQLIGLGIAFVAMLAIAFSDYRRLVEIAPLLYLLGLVCLVMVLVPGIGMKINGHRAWIRLPGAGQFQPSEFVKIPVVLMLAKYFGKHRSGPLTRNELLIGCVILGVPMALILLEHDMGQLLTYIPLLAVVLFLSSWGLWMAAAVRLVCRAGAPRASSALLLPRLSPDARRSRDRTGMLVIMAIVGGLIFQIFLNVGMAVGMLPVIGVPLPLMSAGLSSMLATFIAIGFAISVQLRRFVN